MEFVHVLLLAWRKIGVELLVGATVPMIDENDLPERE